MNHANMVLFLIAYATAAAFPGPGLAALIARVLGRGAGGVVFYIAGFVLGDLVWFAAAAMGLSLLAASLGGAIAIIRYLGAAYLFYLAYRLIRAEPDLEGDPVATSASSPFRDFLAGLFLTLGNPKVIVFFVALLPTVLDLNRLTVARGMVLGSAMALVLTAVLGTYAALAARARRLFRNPRAARALNVGSGAVMAGAAVAVATR